MSHVDKALSAWEADAKIPSRPVPERFRLDQYHREEPATAPAAPEPPSPVLPVPEASTSARRWPSVATSGSESGFRMNFAPSKSPAPATLPPSPRAHTFQPTPELEARLVTGGSGAVPLEQYRRLAAALHDVQLQQGLKTLMLTSALPHEGKTLTVVNLALTLSESYGRRVLIIDADLRWPSVHRMLGLGNETRPQRGTPGPGTRPPHSARGTSPVAALGRPAGSRAVGSPHIGPDGRPTRPVRRAV